MKFTDWIIIINIIIIIYHYIIISMIKYWSVSLSAVPTRWLLVVVLLWPTNTNGVIPWCAGLAGGVKGGGGGGRVR